MPMMRGPSSTGTASLGGKFKRGEFFIAQPGELLHGLTFEAARQHSGGDAAGSFLLTLLLSLFTAFLFQPFGNRHQ
mgnify:CR=1 FL=1